jgi:hypothetical protein
LSLFFVGVYSFQTGRKLTPVQVYTKGIVLPMAPLWNIFSSDNFIPYDIIKYLIWMKKNEKILIELLHSNNRFQLVVLIYDREKFIDACSKYLKVSKEEKSNYDLSKYLNN